MKIRILVGGTKGGSGKGSVSDILALGLANLGHLAFVVKTDLNGLQFETDDDGISTNINRYITINGVGHVNTVKAFSMLNNYKEGSRLAVTIIDGSASDKEDTDIAYAKDSQLVLIPFLSGYEDMMRAKGNMTNMPESFGLPNLWPSEGEMEYPDVMRDFALVFPDMESRILNPVPKRRACRGLARMGRPTTTRLNTTARALAIQVLELMDINPFTKEYPINESI